MTTVDRDLLKTLRTEIDAALASVAAKHNLTLKTGNATFDPSAGSFTFKLEGLAEGGKDKDALRYEQSANWDKSMPPLGSPFTAGGIAYTIVGLNARGTKIIAARSDGKKFLFNRDVAVRLATPITK